MLKLEILKTENELRLWLQRQVLPVHFVPTMGGLHEGHKQLIQAAKKNFPNNPSTVLVSIFINPLQFGPDEDFANYPRNLDADCELAKDSGANAVWVPSIDDVFPGGASSHFHIKVPLGLQSHLCGRFRKGHFDGVATVMLRLLTLLNPKVVVLGEKDWQQLIILRQLIYNLNLKIKVCGVPTIREKDGLAYSSRNVYLSKSERANALALPVTLSNASNQFSQGKKLNFKTMRLLLEEKGLEVEYLEAVDPFRLQPVNPQTNLCLLAAAVRSGRTRLIDHTFLMTRKPIVAIDGPAGAGKSTVTRDFAQKLGLLYLDTGAMYRAVTWLLNNQGINPEDGKSVSQALKDLNLELTSSEKGGQTVLINGQNVSEAIRSPEITSLVSVVASQSYVRKALTAQQKAIGQCGGLVAEGRDIGTAVFPNAELKIFLTASSEERARRRANDLKNQGYDIPDIKELKCQIEERDRLDSTREISPLFKAKDAEEVITDGMNINAVVDHLIDLFRMKIPEEVWPSPSN